MSDSYFTSRSSLTSSIQTQHSYNFSDTLEPLDYEDVLSENATANDKDPLKSLLSFPLDDLQIYLLPRQCRTLTLVVPPEPL